MNQVTLIGRLTRDPDLRTGTTTVARFSLAIDYGYGDKKRTDFPNIVVFGKQAENCERFLKKGRLVAVQGRLQTGSYMKDDIKIPTTDVVADRVEFLEWGDKTETVYEPTPQFATVDEKIPF